MGEKEKLSDLNTMKGGETEDAEEKHDDNEPALPPEAMVMSGPMLLLAMSGFIALLQLLEVLMSTAHVTTKSMWTGLWSLVWAFSGAMMI